jgi:hypothetical protein
MRAWNRLFRRKPSRSKSSPAALRARPCLESLEGRWCPALALTQAGINAGLSLSVFAYDFPHPGTVGPWGITFPSTGGVLVSDSPGHLHYFATDTDGQDAGSVPTQTYGAGNARDIVTIGGKNYMGQDDGSNRIVQVNDDGTFNQVIVSGLTGHSFGMVADPANGHVFDSIEVVPKTKSEIVDVDPNAHTWKKFVTNGLMDGITISADGSTLYAARRTDSHIVGFDTTTGKLVFDSGFVAGGPDGTTVGTGLYTQFLIVNCNDGTVVAINLNTKKQAVVASGGSRGDFARTDYRNGSFLVSQTAEVDRISFPPVFLHVHSPTTVYTGTPFSVTVTAVDGNGNTVTSYTGTVDFTSNDPLANLPGRYTFTSSDQGSHTFSVTLNTKGNESVSITDNANESIDGSISEAVTLPPDHLQIAGTGASVAGSPFSITVTAQDASGNTVTSYSGTVHFSGGGGQAILPADYTFTSSDQGSHTFTNEVTLKAAGLQIFSAYDTADNSVGAVDTVNVSPAGTDHFRVDGPSQVVAGAAFPVTVTAEDPYDNTVTGYAGTVSFGSSDPQQSGLPGNYPFTNIDAGVHIFSVALYTAGTQSVTMADTGTPSIFGNDSGIMVSPAAAAKLAVSGYPNPTVAGARHGFTVTVEDAFGNLVPTYRGNITLRTSDRRGTLSAKSYKLRPADQGSHSFAALFKTAGNQSLMASARGLARDPEAGIVVLPGTPTQLLLSGLPSSCVAGQSKSVSVMLKDAYGNLATNYVGTVHFASSDPQAGLPDPYPFTAADAGRHTFAVTFKTARTQRLVVADTELPGLKALEAGIQVRAAAAASFQFIVPSSVIAGRSFTVTVIARDAFDNIATSYAGAVHLTTGDSQPVLPANFAFKAASHGRQTLKLVLATIDQTTLTATDNNDDIVTGTSAPIQVIG